MVGRPGRRPLELCARTAYSKLGAAGAHFDLAARLHRALRATVGCHERQRFALRGLDARRADRLWEDAPGDGHPAHSNSNQFALDKRQDRTLLETPPG